MKKIILLIFIIIFSMSGCISSQAIGEYKADIYNIIFGNNNIPHECKIIIEKDTITCLISTSQKDTVFDNEKNNKQVNILTYIKLEAQGKFSKRYKVFSSEEKYIMTTKLEVLGEGAEIWKNRKSEELDTISSMENEEYIHQQKELLDGLWIEINNNVDNPFNTIKSTYLSLDPKNHIITNIKLINEEANFDVNTESYIYADVITEISLNNGIPTETRTYKNELLKSKSVYYSNGNVKQNISYSDTGNIEHQFEYEYYDNGNTKHILHYVWHENQKTLMDEYSYDENGNALK